MKKIRLLILLSTVLFVSKSAFAQQDAQFSQYMFNSLYYNPGFAGVEGVTRLTGIHRTQWLNYSPDLYDGGAPQSTIFSASTPFPKQKMGLGSYIMVDRLGPLMTINFDLSVSKHVKIGTGTLGIGLSGGVLSQRINADQYRVVDENDPIFIHLVSQGIVSQIRPDLSAGLWYNHRKYYFGASFNHLVRSKYSYGFDAIRSQMNNHMYITGGYHIQLLPNLVLTPSALVQSDLNSLTYLFGAIATLDEKMYAGINVRQSFAQRLTGANQGRSLSNDDIILLVGVNVLKNAQGVDALRIGYAFDFVTSGVDAKKRTSHEIMLSYLIPNPFGQASPPVRTPRYRHDN